MKKCPLCQQVFDDTNDYCLNDGTPLVVISSGAYDTPTQVFQTPQYTAAPSVQRSGASPVLYLLIGVLGAGFVAALIFIFAMPRGEEKPDPSETRNSNKAGLNQNAAMAANTNTSKPITITTPAENAPAANTAVSVEQAPAMTEATARDILTRWQQSQNGRNFAEYASLYAPVFVGYKVTPTGKADRMNRDQWLRDRRKMLLNFIEVRALNERVRLDGGTAVVTFTQQWRSARHCDIGEKELTVQMINGRPMIRSEVIRNPYPC